MSNTWKITLFLVKSLLITLIGIYLPSFFGAIQKAEAFTFTQKNNQKKDLFLEGRFLGEDTNHDGLLTLAEITDFTSTVFDVSSLSDTGDITFGLAQLTNFEYKIGTTKNLLVGAGPLILTANSGLIRSEEFNLVILNSEGLGSALSNTFTLIDQDETITGVADNFGFQAVIVRVPESSNGLAMIILGILFIFWKKKF